MKLKRYTDIGLEVSAGLLLAIALLLTFTVSDYYIFNRISEYGFIFTLSQWVKKAGLLLIPLAVYYNKKCCADIAKYVLPVFVIISCCTFGSFFDATAITETSTPAQLVFAHINEFMPKAANMALFFVSNALYIIICAGLFIRDGYKVNAKSFIWLPFAFVACMPLNIFENFFDINEIPADSFLRFKNFTVWHALAIIVLAGFTVASYYFLRNKDKRTQDGFLIAGAIVMLIQYHSKDSMVMGDGYNVYNTIFACIPLFICNIGVYVAALSVIIKKRITYSISFFVHAAGAISVFVYFGRDEISNYGIFCSYSILYFCATHCLLFALSVLPSALGHYKFRLKDCIIPLVYYLCVIIIASVASALVTSASMEFSYNGYVLDESEYILPNYAFTQINPLPFEVPLVGLTIWRYDLSVLYILGLYAFYVGIFAVFNIFYYSFLFIRKKLLHRKIQVPELQAEAAATNDENQE
ncbi:MAG: YwaF family protein [Clostridia bacterium]|nr:YwaF family protein [Clostridia bacterium]